jgi:hypothetical protein
VKIRFLADARSEQSHCERDGAPGAIAGFLTAQSAGLRNMNDAEVLALAAEQHRVLVSHDVGTMPAHFRTFRNAGKRSSGVFLIHQRLDVGTAIEELLLIWLASEASDWEDRLEWLPL